MTASGEDAAAFCAAEVREHEFPRYAASLFANAEQRRALIALYAFAGELARVRDHVTQPLPGEIRLQWWSDALTGEGHGGTEGHPVLAELKHAVAGFNLPLDDLLRMVEAWRFDLYDDPISSEDELDAQLADTHAALFRLAARICGGGVTASSIDLARRAGLAEGLAWVTTMLPRHASRRQMYLPGQLLELNGVTSADLFAGKATPALRTVIAHLVREARSHLAAVALALGPMPAELRPVFLPLATVKRQLARLEKVGFDPFRAAAPSRIAVLWDAWRAAADISRLAA
jgi:phytoene synthase